MQPSNQAQNMPIVSVSDDYKQQMDEAARLQGVVPFDTLPAQWWNWLWYTITVAQNQMNNALNSLYSEVSSVLEAVGVTADATVNNQILTAIKRLIIAQQTDDSTTVISSEADDSVSIAADKTMVVNALRDIADLNGTTIVQALNQVTAKLAGINDTVMDVTDALDARVTALEAGSAVFVSESGTLYITTDA